MRDERQLTYDIHYNDEFRGQARLTPGEVGRLTLKGYTITAADGGHDHA